MLERDWPVAVYMEGAVGLSDGKMGYGVLRYLPNPVVAVIDSRTSGEDLARLTGIERSAPIVSSVHEAVALGAQALILGIAPPGGLIPADWWPVIDEAIAQGMSIVNGLHDQIAPRYDALKAGQWIWDVRIEPEGLGVGTGAAASLPNKRVLMIGTDMAIGKMTAGLELYAASKRRGISTEFVATGQIGITVTGRGVPLDAVRVDYACGAIEREVMRAAEAELVIVEGQGALIHPGSTANLPLLRGSCPTHLILCHRHGQSFLRRIPSIAIPPLRDYVRMYEDLAAACGVFPRPRTVGVSLITEGVDDTAAREALASIEQETGLPATDPVRFGVDGLLTAIVGE